MRRFKRAGRAGARRSAVFALLGALALGGCTPEGKGSIKIEGKQADVVKNLAPPDTPSKTATRKQPQIKSMKTRGTSLE